MNVLTLGDLRKFLDQNQNLPDDMEIIGMASNYPTDVTIKTGTYSRKFMEFSGNDLCIIVSCKQ